MPAVLAEANRITRGEVKPVPKYIAGQGFLMYCSQNTEQTFIFPRTVGRILPLILQQNSSLAA